MTLERKTQKVFDKNRLFASLYAKDVQKCVNITESFQPKSTFCVFICKGRKKNVESC